MSYFDAEKKKLAMDELETIYNCAEKAGMRDAVFIGFGLLLGIVRERDFIGHDNDMDVCIRADLIEPAQEVEYYRRIKEAGLFFARRRMTFRDVPEGFDRGLIQSAYSDDSKVPGDGSCRVRFAWFSLRKRQEYCKCCNWFFFPWNGYFWHTKGNMWVSRRKFDPGKYQYNASHDAVMKGIPEEYVRDLKRVKFHGLEVMIPKNYGTCLDFWYPGWRIPRKGGSSAKTVTCSVKNWKDQKSWSVHIN